MLPAVAFAIFGAGYESTPQAMASLRGSVIGQSPFPRKRADAVHLIVSQQELHARNTFVSSKTEDALQIERDR